VECLVVGRCAKCFRGASYLSDFRRLPRRDTGDESGPKPGSRGGAKSSGELVLAIALGLASASLTVLLFLHDPSLSAEWLSGIS
jgi:hypothetical protein